MSDQQAEFLQANDSLHVLPLNIIPLETQALRDARLTKNARLEGVVELFSDRQTGSGQIYPHALNEFFDFRGDCRKDYDVILALGELPSYDVYSLRIELRELGIDVDESQHLRLSKEMERELSGYMQTFTRPLIAAVYGKEGAKGQSFSSIVGLLLDPNVQDARKNLMSLAAKLEVELLAIPQFLMRYGDVYLSLAYYSFCMDQIRPTLQDFLNAVDELLGDPKLRNDRHLVDACKLVKGQLRGLEIGVSQVMEIFRVHTENMWQSISASRFRAMEKLILQYQKEIGGTICALTVKMNGWAGLKGKRQASSRASFILSDMVQGLDQLRPIDIQGARH